MDSLTRYLSVATVVTFAAKRENTFRPERRVSEEGATYAVYRQKRAYLIFRLFQRYLLSGGANGRRRQTINYKMNGKGQKGKQSECAEKQNPNGTKRADVRALFP